MSEPTVGESGSASFLRAVFFCHTVLLALPLVQANQFLWALGRTQSFIVPLIVTNLIAMGFVLLCLVAAKKVERARSDHAARRFVRWTVILLFIVYTPLGIGAVAVLTDGEHPAVGRFAAALGLMGLPLSVAMILAYRRLQSPGMASVGAAPMLLAGVIALPAIAGGMATHYASFHSAQSVQEQFICELNMKMMGNGLMMVVDAWGLPRQLDTPELYRVLGYSDIRHLSCPCDPGKQFAYLMKEMPPAEGDASAVSAQDAMRVPLLWDHQPRHGRKLNVLMAEIAFVERTDGAGRVMRLVEHVPQQMTPDELQTMLQQVRPLIPLMTISRDP